MPTEGQKDPRMEFLSDYTCKSMRLKPDKWARMMVSDESRTFLNKFVESTHPQVTYIDRFHQEVRYISCARTLSVCRAH